MSDKLRRDHDDRLAIIAERMKARFEDQGHELCARAHGIRLPLSGHAAARLKVQRAVRWLLAFPAIHPIIHRRRDHHHHTTPKRTSRRSPLAPHKTTARHLQKQTQLHFSRTALRLSSPRRLYCGMRMWIFGGNVVELGVHSKCLGRWILRAIDVSARRYVITWPS